MTKKNLYVVLTLSALLVLVFWVVPLVRQPVVIANSEAKDSVEAKNPVFEENDRQNGGSLSVSATTTPENRQKIAINPIRTSKESKELFCDEDLLDYMKINSKDPRKWEEFCK